MASQHRRNIGGALWILQLWAFERLTPLRPRYAALPITQHLPLGDRWAGPRERRVRGAPRHDLSYFRLLLDRLRYGDIVWQPYTDDLLRSIPSQYLAGSEVWRARVPLIYYNIVEWHQPDRVLQQFGLIQPIPLAPVQDHRLHSLLYKSSNNYMEILGYYVLIWLHRESHVVGGYRFERPPHYHSQYMEWYRRHTRRWITWQGAADGSSRDLAEMVHVRRSSRDSIIGSAARSSQMAYMEDRRDVTLPPPEPAVPAFVLPFEVKDVKIRNTRDTRMDYNETHSEKLTKRRNGYQEKIDVTRLYSAKYGNKDLNTVMIIRINIPQKS
ncbi:serine/threonine-protein phosphatase 7 long form homolog [Mercurialis annua]|uniref:serine/threonine-protein phosphatase 7 long form homolog n=1 Tax=Mercurialis annua TaxID=3986 RepID=UPI0024ACCC99|nr:serine/threonine-protein phosphatase 7 long form homolog [Mercurialis annua]